MEKLTDKELFDELTRRFEMNRRMAQIHDEMMIELRAANQKLLESEKVQSQFLSNIRNEINNPLTSIMGLTRALRDEKTIPKTQAKSIELIYSEAYNLEFQMQNIFVAAELEAGESLLYMTKVDVDSVIKSTIESFTHIRKKKNIKIEYNATFPDKKDAFNTDPDKLKTILSNLVMNALEFSEPNSKVNVNATITEADRLEIAVVDSGEGIAKKDFNKIFDRFIQLDSGSTKKHQGHGIGLSVVKASIECLEGEIDVASELGKGSTFTISIPQGHIDEHVDEFSHDGNEFLFFDDSDAEVI